MSEHTIKIESSSENLHVKVDQRKRLLNSFGSGILFGVGSAIGATFIFGLIIFLLGKLNTVPLVGEYIQNIIEYIQNTTT